jgi:integrase
VPCERLVARLASLKRIELSLRLFRQAGANQCRHPAYRTGIPGVSLSMLRVGDIDSKRMLIRVEMGKRRKDQHAMLSPQLLELLRGWCRSKGWLFPGRDPRLPITVRQLNRACHMAACRGLGSWVSPHTLRHSFAAHLLESCPS